MRHEDPHGDPMTIDAGHGDQTRRVVAIPPLGAFCDHAKMTECCDGCGHFSCACGVAWDEESEGGFFETYEGEFS